MTGRLLPTLVALFLLSTPVAAVAQESGYGDTPTTEAQPTPTTPAPAPGADDDVAVQAETAQGEAIAPSAAVAGTTANGAATGPTPGTLAYTGSEVWLVALLGLLALAGGAALMRPSRRA
jgi:hypothetical protein